MKHMIGIKMDLVLSLVSLALISMLVPSYAYGQVAALQPTPMPIQTQTQMVYTQCIDFNMDKVCEYIVLANGTTIANPLVQQIQAPAPMSQLAERQKVIIQEQQRDNDDDGDRNDPCNYYGRNICDPTGKCDNDRFDCYSDDCVNGQSGTTGQCEGDDRPYGSNNNDGASNNNNDEEELPNCNDVEYGTHCDGSEDEDSWTDDEEEDSWVDEPAAEEEEGTWEDDGYIDENGDGDYDEGEE